MKEDRHSIILLFNLLRDLHQWPKLCFRETTGAPMWTRFKGLWWIKREKWSTGFLGNGTRAFTVESRLLPNASGGQVGFSSSVMMLKDASKFSFLSYSRSSFVLILLARFHAYRLWNVLRLHQIRHRAERALSWAEGCPASHRCQIQTRSKAAAHIPLAFKWSKFWMPVLRCAVLLLQVFGGRKLGDGSIREAAHWGRAEDQEKMERGEQHQTRAALLQVRTELLGVVLHEGFTQHNRAFLFLF